MPQGIEREQLTMLSLLFEAFFRAFDEARPRLESMGNVSES